MLNWLGWLNREQGNEDVAPPHSLRSHATFAPPREISLVTLHSSLPLQYFIRACFLYIPHFPSLAADFPILESFYFLGIVIRDCPPEFRGKGKRLVFLALYTPTEKVDGIFSAEQFPPFNQLGNSRRGGINPGDKHPAFPFSFANRKAFGHPMADEVNGRPWSQAKKFAVQCCAEL